ncbi:MAG: RNA polymerase sigma factor [Inquilinus sp.]|nr:RNA polymerase sigma factor [Inquilinus sp.]
MGDAGQWSSGTASQAQDDDALMGAVGHGARDAFAVLMERHLDRTLALATRITGNRGLAEDVAQEAFLRVWRTATDWQPGRARFTTWLYRVTVNLCLDFRRRPVFAALESIEDPPDPEGDAISVIEARQRQALLRREIAALAGRQRAALALCYAGGLSNAEAAEVLEISVGALESLLVRARRRLRQRLSGRLGG